MKQSQHQEYIRIVPGAKCAVLMVHGICCTPRHFDFLLPHIPEDVTVCNLLLDGHGSTVTDFSRTSMKKWQAQVEGWMDTLCVNHSQVLLVGYSLGTLLLMNAARGRPQVKGILLMNPPLCPRPLPKMVLFSLGMAFGKTSWRSPYWEAMSQDISIRLSPVLPLYLGWIPRFWELLVLCRKTQAVSMKLKLPCHVFLGKKDELVSMRSQAYVPHHPAVKLHIMEKAGHSHYPPEDQAAMEAAFRELLKLAENRVWDHETENAAK